MTTPGDPGSADWALPGASVPPPGWSAEQPPPAPTTGWGPAYAPPPPPQPGIIPLRPLGVGEMLDAAFTAIRRYPRPTLGLAAAVMAVVTVIDVAVRWYAVQGTTAPADGAPVGELVDYASRVGTAAVASAVIGAVATLLLSGLITAVVGEAVLGRPVTIGDAWQRLRPVVWRLLGASALVFLAVAGVFVVAVVPGAVVVAVGDDRAGAALLAIGALAGLALAAWLFVAFALAPAAVVLERQTARGALRRSRALVRGSWWRTFGILLLAVVIANIVSGIITVPFAIAGGGLSSFADDSELHLSTLVVSGVGNLLAATLVRPFSAGVTALLYVDRRIRREALDVALARAAGS